MKKLLIAGILCLLGIAGLPAFAQHQIDSVFILVDLMDDGSARVRERRDCQMSEQGTEGYITFNNMGDIELKDLQVFDEEGVDYEVEEEWNVDRSREEKTRRCGYHRTSEGLEVCWGIGKAGKRRYYIFYTLTNLVKSYDDFDGFCHSFYEAANSPAAFAMVNVIMDVDSLSKKDARLWTFGYDGWKGHCSNYVWARTEEDAPMRNGDAIIMLMEIKRGLLHPTVKKEGTFKELVKRPALEGSEYDIEVALGDTLEDGTLRSSLMGGQIGSGHEGSPVHSYSFSQEEDGGCFNWGLIGGFLLILTVQHLYEAFILRMFYQGGITLDYDTDKHGKNRQLFRIHEPVKPAKKPELDVTKNAESSFSLYGSRRRVAQELYQGMIRDEGILYLLHDLLYKAANEDHLLQPDELRAYVKKNIEQLRPMADVLYNVIALRKDDNALRAEEVQQVVGFVHYLKDFSLVQERHIEEVSLWKEYLVFASFYGIADQVRRDMKKVAPDTTKLDELIPPHQVVEDFKPITTALNTSLYAAYVYETAYEREQHRSYSSSSGGSSSSRSYSSSSGGSGHSSYSGGGGHTGGGGSGFR